MNNSASVNNVLLTAPTKQSASRSSHQEIELPREVSFKQAFNSAKESSDVNNQQNLKKSAAKIAHNKRTAEGAKKNESAHATHSSASTPKKSTHRNTAESVTAAEKSTLKPLTRRENESSDTPSNVLHAPDSTHAPKIKESELASENTQPSTAQADATTAEATMGEATKADATIQNQMLNDDVIDNAINNSEAFAGLTINPLAADGSADANAQQSDDTVTASDQVHDKVTEERAGISDLNPALLANQPYEASVITPAASEDSLATSFASSGSQLKNTTRMGATTVNENQTLLSDKEGDALSEALDLKQPKFPATNTTTTATQTPVELMKQIDAGKGDENKMLFDKMLQTMASNTAQSQSFDASAPAALLNPQDASTGGSAFTAEGLSRLPELPATRGFIVQTAVPIPVGHPQWNQAVGEKVLWLAAQNVSSAEIHLHPLDLGPVQVNVSLHQDQTNVSFSSHHPVVRELLDQNLHRLREMFAEQGLQLGQVDVSDKSFQRHQNENNPQGKSTSPQGTVTEEETPIALSTIVQKRLVDHYA